MEALLALLLLALIAAAGYGIYRVVKGKKKAPGARTGKDPLLDIHDTRNKLTRIKPGDIVNVNQVDHSVRGSVSFNEDGFTWEEHFIDNGQGSKTWLSVEVDPESDNEIEVALWSADDIEAPVGEKNITVGGVNYRRVERGRARYRASGTTGLPLDGSVEYVDYKGEDGTLLGFESFNGAKWEAATGRPISAGLITVYHAKED